MGAAVNESHLLNPVSEYGKMHVQIEKFLELLPNVTRLRIGNLYGRSQQARQQQGLIAHAIRSARLQIPFEIFGTGDETRDYISIESAAQQAVMLSELVTPAVINLGTGIATSTNQILKFISDYLKVPIQKNFHPKRKFDIDHNMLDISQLKKLIHIKEKAVLDALPLILEPIN